jgi:hypothetical protein
VFLSIEQVLHFLSRFDHMTRALQTRAQNKPPVELKDEYDVQDLVYAALKPMIPDLKREDPYPKRAGQSGKLDLRSQRMSMLIEIKSTLKDGRAEKIPNECLERVQKYAIVEGLQHMIFFLHDPGGRIDAIDEIQHDLEKRVTIENEASFMVYVVGNGLNNNHPPKLSAPTPPTVVVNDVKFMPQWKGVLVDVRATAPGKPVADSVRLRLGTRVHEPTNPPPNIVAPAVQPRLIQAPGRLFEMERACFYFGSSQNGGLPITGGCSGLLEVEVGGQVSHAVVDIPLPERREMSDEDAMIKLTAWFYGLKDGKKTGEIVFADVDATLGLVEGTAKRLLCNAASQYYDVKHRGEECVMFEQKPHRIADTSDRMRW